METLNMRLRKSGKEWSDQSSRWLKDTREAGKHFAEFVQHEAKDWGDYLLERSRALASEGWVIPGTDIILSRFRQQEAEHEESSTEEAQAERASDVGDDEGEVDESRETEVFEKTVEEESEA